MPIPKRVFVTRATAVAMKKILAATNSAYATFITVILFFLCLVIKKLALVTVVSTHAHTTVLAHLLHILLTIAKRANDLLYMMPWNIMAFFSSTSLTFFASLWQ